MKDFIFQKQWNWKASGIALSLMFVLAVGLVKPIGVSTQFVILDGIIWNMVSDTLIEEDATTKTGYSSSNAYFDRSGGKYAKSIENPLNYSFIFVIAMIAGGFLSSRYLSRKTNIKDSDEKTPSPTNTKKSSTNYYLTIFIGGVLVLIGARLAGGCTSGHMMSGMMQTSISGYLFVLAVFAVAIPTTLLIHRKGKK